MGKTIPFQMEKPGTPVSKSSTPTLPGVSGGKPPLLPPHGYPMARADPFSPYARSTLVSQSFNN